MKGFGPHSMRPFVRVDAVTCLSDCTRKYFGKFQLEVPLLALQLCDQ